MSYCRDSLRYVTTIWCAVRHNFRKVRNSTLILEKRRTLISHELALQAGGVGLQADADFLKIGRIVDTFLKIVRIFQNQDVLGYNLRRDDVRRNKNAPHPQFRKIRHKIRKQAGIRANFRKRALQENPPKYCFYANRIVCKYLA